MAKFSLEGSLRRLLLAGGVLLTANVALAQRAHGGQPLNWGDGAPLRAGIPVVTVVGPDPVEQAAAMSIDGEFRYGVQRFHSVDLVHAADWTMLPDGRRAGQVMIESPGAVMLSLQFDVWQLPADAEVFLYNADRTFYIGSFRGSNAAPDGGLATEVVPGDRVVVEYIVPGNDPGQLHLASITHGIADIFRFGEAGYLRDIDPGYQSAPCHNNVVCPIAAAWQDQKRAVALFLRPDGNGCTGVLVNNTAIPGKPYFHVANHCYQPNESQWVFYFNYDAPACVGSAGPTGQTLSGAVRRAAFYFDDFCLVELFDTPPPYYNVYYAGWDRSGNGPQSQTVIHHPLFDVKKITFDLDPATSYADAEGIQMWRNFWDSGIVEPVSSGAPLFDHNKRIIGHMTEGAQTCANVGTVSTGCAKFSASWDGATPATRLRDWLDPSNSTVVLNGYDPNASGAVLVSVRAYLEGPYNTSTMRMGTGLRDLGLVPTVEPYTGLGYAHVGGGGEFTSAPVLAATGEDAIVDWVVVELRDEASPSTVVATRSALLQSDGDIVDMDGVSPVAFPVATGAYRVALQHRNHLGVITAAAVQLSATTSLVDLSNGTTPLQGGTTATNESGGRRLLVPGDCLRDGVLRYTGASNDRDAILTRVGGSVPTSSLLGYFTEDANMDGLVRYVGSGNDRDIVLQSIGGAVPTATRVAQLP
ncbi:MAG: hypothetical protein R2817_07185 [Flavobacteriales bacterium]